MIKILFVCLGNICRSPMAEFMLKDMVKNKNIEDKFYIDSCATSSEEIGNEVYYKAKAKLLEYGINTGNKTAKKIKKDDYEKFDYIIGMEERNVNDIKKITAGDKENKIFKLHDFSESKKDIADPWYTDDFDKAYTDIKEGLENFLHFLGY